MGVVRERGLDFKPKVTFDKCMANRPCKIGFIVVCVVVGLIVFSLLWCCLRCLMCGYACCTCCCGGCGGRRHKREQQHSAPPPLINRQPASVDEPKYAYFDTNDDALPHMPSLNQCETVRINIGESHEMETIQKPSQSSPHLQQSGRMRSPSPARAQEYYAHDDKAHLVRSSSAASSYSHTPQYSENVDHGHGVPQYGQHDANNYGHEAYGRDQYQYQAHAYLTPAPQRTYDPNDRRRHEEWTMI